MIDIHNHILPGIDDGAENMRETAKMLSIAVSEGIDIMIATSHGEAGRDPEYRRKYMEALMKVRTFIEKRNLPIRIYSGNELYYSEGILQALAKREVLTLNNTKYVLVEFPYYESFENIDRAVHNLLNHGYWPILAHIERYQALRTKKAVEEIIEAGACIQMNASSIMGKAGLRTKLYCRMLLKMRYVDFVATDSHGCKNRRPKLKDCRTYIQKKYGTPYCRLVLERNPRKLLKGEKIRGKD